MTRRVGREGVGKDGKEKGGMTRKGGRGREKAEVGGEVGKWREDSTWTFVEGPREFLVTPVHPCNAAAATDE